MSTSAFLLYTTPAGDLEGTSISRMGGTIPEQVAEKFGKDYDAIVKHIAEGRKRGGYRLISDDEPYWDADDEDLIITSIQAGMDADYAWHLLPSGTVELVEIVPTFRLVSVK